MLVSPLHTLAHVASQIRNRWSPPPADAPLFSVPCATLMTPAEWSDYFDEVRALLPVTVPRDILLPAARLHLKAVADHAATYMTWADARYPALLRLIRDPPLALTMRGDVGLLGRPTVAVVGSRKASALAMRESFLTGQVLADLGMLVVSGGAFGCDIAAHHGVLASRSPEACAGVFAGGLSALYPIGNKKIFDKIQARGGLFVSERLWHAPSLPHDFTARNRIIAGLCPTTLVMQAAARSGALVTARLALDEGREVMALVHPSGDVRAAGSATLIADGAQPFASGATLLKG